jgi:GxxExxY protein
MIENEISYKIRGSIFKVYNTLGPGLLESVYESALYYQLKKMDLRSLNKLKYLLNMTTSY